MNLLLNETELSDIFIIYKGVVSTFVRRFQQAGHLSWCRLNWRDLSTEVGKACPFFIHWQIVKFDGGW